MQEGTYNIQVIVKDGFRGSTGESTIATYTAQTRVVGNSAVVSPMANPLVALYSAPPSPGASMYVQFAQAGPHPVVAEYLPAAHRSRREHQLHRGRHAAQHDLSDAGRPGRRDGLRPAGVHHREPAGQPEFPHLHRACSRRPPGRT